MARTNFHFSYLVQLLIIHFFLDLLRQADQIATRCNMEVSDTRLLCNGQIISSRPFADLKSCGLNDGDFIRKLEEEKKII